MSGYFQSAGGQAEEGLTYIQQIFRNERKQKPLTWLKKKENSVTRKPVEGAADGGKTTPVIYSHPAWGDGGARERGANQEKEHGRRLVELKEMKSRERYQTAQAVGKNLKAIDTRELKLEYDLKCLD